MLRDELQCWPARQQQEANESDLVLKRRATIHHPHARWWWNQKTENFHREAYCFLCDKPLATWDSKYPITVTAIKAVEEHREQHLKELREENENV